MDEDHLENSMSLAAIEAELKPKVLETFDTIASSFKRLRRLQEQDIHNKLHSTGSLTPSQERKYKKLKEEIIREVKSLRLNQARIDALVEQLYDINKRLVGHEGRLMRLSECHGVSREEFLKNYQGNELLGRLRQHPDRNSMVMVGRRLLAIGGKIHSIPVSRKQGMGSIGLARSVSKLTAIKREFQCCVDRAVV